MKLKQTECPGILNSRVSEPSLLKHSRLLLASMSLSPKCDNILHNELLPIARAIWYVYQHHNREHYPTLVLTHNLALESLVFGEGPLTSTLLTLVTPVMWKSLHLAKQTVFVQKSGNGRLLGKGREISRCFGFSICFFSAFGLAARWVRSNLEHLGEVFHLLWAQLLCMHLHYLTGVHINLG